MDIEIIKPDDWHLHLRDGERLKAVLPFTAQQFGRAIVMPNLKPPVVTTERALRYRERIMASLPEGSSFQPLMTLYLTDNTSPEEIITAKESGHVYAVKLYPAGATTNSDSGVTGILKMDDVFAALSEQEMPLLIHGEVTDHKVDIFDRESVFLQRTLPLILERHKKLRVVLEHITTADSVEFVRQADSRVGATITAHHLLSNRNDMLVGGIRPHLYCLPILKKESDRLALVSAAISGNPKFFLGTDSAPHPIGAKESACGCAGCFTAHAAMQLYAEVFDKEGELRRLEGFSSRFGPDFYRLPYNKETIKLVKSESQVPSHFQFGSDLVRPYRAGKKVHWKIIYQNS